MDPEHPARFWTHIRQGPRAVASVPDVLEVMVDQVAHIRCAGIVHVVAQRRDSVVDRSAVAVLHRLEQRGDVVEHGVAVTAMMPAPAGVSLSRASACPGTRSVTGPGGRAGSSLRRIVVVAGCSPGT